MATYPQTLDGVLEALKDVYEKHNMRGGGLSVKTSDEVDQALDAAVDLGLLDENPKFWNTSLYAGVRRSLGLREVYTKGLKNMKLTKVQLEQIIREEVLYEIADSRIKKIVDWHEANKKRLSIDDAMDLANDVGEGEAWGGPRDVQQAKEQEDLINKIAGLAGMRSWDELLAAYHEKEKEAKDVQKVHDKYDVGGDEWK